METGLYANMTSALAVALVATAVFVGAAKAWLLAARGLQRKSEFSQQILYEAGHRFRRELQSVDTQYALFLLGMLVFVLLFVTVFILRPGAPPFDLPSWVWIVCSVLLVGASLYLPYEAFKLRSARKKLAYSRDAHMAIGHALLRTVGMGNRVFYHVRTNGTVVDNVVVGQKGIFAVNVFALPPPKRKRPTVRFDGTYLDFGGVRISRQVAETIKRAKGLARDLTKVCGHPVMVRSVIALPGWNVESPRTDSLLLVNEKNVVMLTGWTHADAYLMDDDVDKICNHLADQCRNGMSVPP